MHRAPWAASPLSLAGRVLVDPLGELRRALGIFRLAPGEVVAPPMGEAVHDRGPLLLQRALPEAAVREPSPVFLPLPVPAHQLCAAGIPELPYGCRGLETVLDAELGRSFPLFRGVYAVLQTPSSGTDFRYHPLTRTANCSLQLLAKTIVCINRRPEVINEPGRHL